MLSEAWGLYKAHSRHLLSISFIVYAAVAIGAAYLLWRVFVAIRRTPRRTKR